MVSDVATPPNQRMKAMLVADGRFTQRRWLERHVGLGLADSV